MTETVDPAIRGPYDAEQNGFCAEGHALNGFGRCALLNGETTVPFPAPGGSAPASIDGFGFQVELVGPPLFRETGNRLTHLCGWSEPIPAVSTLDELAATAAAHVALGCLP
jgi:hypothetical protein